MLPGGLSDAVGFVVGVSEGEDSLPFWELAVDKGVDLTAFVAALAGGPAGLAAAIAVEVVKNTILLPIEYAEQEGIATVQIVNLTDYDLKIDSIVTESGHQSFGPEPNSVIRKRSMTQGDSFAVRNHFELFSFSKNWGHFGIESRITLSSVDSGVLQQGLEIHVDVPFHGFRDNVVRLNGGNRLKPLVSHATLQPIEVTAGLSSADGMFPMFLVTIRETRPKLTLNRQPAEGSDSYLSSYVSGEPIVARFENWSHGDWIGIYELNDDFSYTSPIDSAPAVPARAGHGEVTFSDLADGKYAMFLRSGSNDDVIASQWFTVSTVHESMANDWSHVHGAPYWRDNAADASADFGVVDELNGLSWLDLRSQEHTLPPGRYEATCRVKKTNTYNAHPLTLSATSDQFNETSTLEVSEQRVGEWVEETVAFIVTGADTPVRFMLRNVDRVSKTGYRFDSFRIIHVSEVFHHSMAGWSGWEAPYWRDNVADASAEHGVVDELNYIWWLDKESYDYTLPPGHYRATCRVKKTHANNVHPLILRATSDYFNQESTLEAGEQRVGEWVTETVAFTVTEADTSVRFSMRNINTYVIKSGYRFDSIRIERL
jgi:hypothetical protein